MEKSLLPSVSSIRSMPRYWWTPYRLLFWGLLSGHHFTRSSASPIRDGLFIFGDQFYLYRRTYSSNNHEVSKLNIFHMWIRTLTYHTQTGHHSPSILQSYISYFWLKHRENVGTDLRDADRAAKLFLTVESFLWNNPCAADSTHTEGHCTTQRPLKALLTVHRSYQETVIKGGFQAWRGKGGASQRARIPVTAGKGLRDLLSGCRLQLIRPCAC